MSDQISDAEHHRGAEGNTRSSFEMSRKRHQTMYSPELDLDLPSPSSSSRSSSQPPAPVFTEAQAAIAATFVHPSDPAYLQEFPAPRNVTNRTSGDVEALVQRGTIGASSIARNVDAGLSSVHELPDSDLGYGDRNENTGPSNAAGSYTGRNDSARNSFAGPQVLHRGPNGESTPAAPARAIVVSGTGTSHARAFDIPLRTLGRPVSESAATSQRHVPSMSSPLAPRVEPTGTVTSRAAIPRPLSSHPVSSQSTPAQRPSPPQPARPTQQPPPAGQIAEEEDIIIPVDLAADIDTFIEEIKEDMFQGWNGMDILKKHVTSCGDRMNRSGMQQIRQPTRPKAWLNKQTEELQEVWAILDRIKKTFAKIQDKIAAFKEIVP